jgi:hypothetical protein
VKRKTLHHSIDNTILRGRVGAQAFFETTKEREPLSGDNVNGSDLVVA